MQSQTFDLHGVPTVCYGQGDGPAFVLLHGSADHPLSWRGVVAALGTGLRVVCPQLPAVSHPGQPALERDLPWLDDVMAWSGARMLAGHSYGGLLALRWALRHPQAYDALVLLEPIAWGALREAGATATVQAELGRCAQLFGSGDGEAALAWLVDYWNGVGSWARLPAATREGLRTGIGRTWAEVESGSADRTTQAEFAGLCGTVELVCGAQTTDASRQLQALLAAARPATGWTLVEGAGHGLVRSHPHAVAAVLQRVANQIHPLPHPTAAHAERQGARHVP